MMLYLFVQRNGNHECHGVEIPQDELPDIFVGFQTMLTQAGYGLSSSSEYTAQLLNGAKSGMESGKMPEVPKTE